MSLRWKQPIWPALKATLINWNAHDCSLLSAAMAFYAAFSLLPLLLVLISGIGLLARVSTQAQDTRQELLRIAGQNAGPWVASQLDKILAGVETQAGINGPLGLAALVFAAIGIFAQFENLFQRIWSVPGAQPKGLIAAVRGALYERVVAFLMLLVIGAGVIVIFITNLVLAGLRPHVVHWAGGQIAWQAGQTLTTLSFNVLLFGLIYKTLPRVRIRWREAFAGGALVAVVWEIGQRIFERVVVTSSFSAYGLIGSFMALMLWMYYASAVIFLGAEFVQTLSRDFRPVPAQLPSPGRGDMQLPGAEAPGK